MKNWVLFSSTIYLLLVVSSCSQPQSSGDETSAEEGLCLQVTIDDLFARPHDYNEMQICTEAMINVEFEGMKIYPPSLQNNPYSDTSMNLYIGMSIGEALDRNLRNRDWVSVNGIFSIHEDCWPDLETAGDDEGFCVPSRSASLGGGTITFLRRDPLRETCNETNLENYPFDANNWDRSIICAQGRIHSHNAELYLAATSTPHEFDPAQALTINELFLEHKDWDMLPGDIVSVTGETDGNTIRLFEIEILQRDPIFEICLQVDIRTIYAYPLMYSDTIICTEGYLSFDETAGSFLLPRVSYDARQAAKSRIDVGWVFPETEFYYQGPGERVRVAGLLRAHRRCRSEDLTLEELAARFARSDYCPPVNIPLTLDISEMDYLEQ